MTPALYLPILVLPTIRLQFGHYNDGCPNSLIVGQTLVTFNYLSSSFTMQNIYGGSAFSGGAIGVSELDPTLDPVSQIVAFESIPTQGFNRTCKIITTQDHNTIHNINYSTILNNSAKFQISYFFYEQADQIFFANQTFNISAQAFKFSVDLKNWPFQSEGNNFTAIFKVDCSDPVVNATVAHYGGMSHGLVNTVTNTTLQFNFIDFAEIDGRIVDTVSRHVVDPLSFISQVKSVSFIFYFPFFHELTYDPGKEMVLWFITINCNTQTSASFSETLRIQVTLQPLETAMLRLRLVVPTFWIKANLAPYRYKNLQV